MHCYGDNQPNVQIQSYSVEHCSMHFCFQCTVHRPQNSLTDRQIFDVRFVLRSCINFQLVYNCSITVSTVTFWITVYEIHCTTLYRGVRDKYIHTYIHTYIHRYMAEKPMLWKAMKEYNLPSNSY